MHEYFIYADATINQIQISHSVICCLYCQCGSHSLLPLFCFSSFSFPPAPGPFLSQLVSALSSSPCVPMQFNLTDWSQMSKKECVKNGGLLVGNACKYVPDLALMSFILFFGTYSMTVSLKKFKSSRYFPTKVRLQETLAQVLQRQTRLYPVKISFTVFCTTLVFPKIIQK